MLKVEGGEGKSHRRLVDIGLDIIKQLLLAVYEHCELVEHLV